MGKDYWHIMAPKGCLRPFFKRTSQDPIRSHRTATEICATPILGHAAGSAPFRTSRYAFRRRLPRLETNKELSNSTRNIQHITDTMGNSKLFSLPRHGAGGGGERSNDTSVYPDDTIFLLNIVQCPTECLSYLRNLLREKDIKCPHFCYWSTFVPLISDLSTFLWAANVANHGRTSRFPPSSRC